MRIGLDIDGVMYKWQKTACYMIRDVLPDSPYKDRKDLSEDNWSGWNWLKDQVAPEHWRWLWNEGVRLGLFRYGHLYPGTIQAIRTLAGIGDVVLITHRPKTAVGDTLAWLGLLNLPISGLHLLTNEEPKSCVRPMCDVYLDDKPDNVIDLRENTDAKMVCLMRRPWNTVFHTRCLDRSMEAGVVENWNEFVAVTQVVRGML